MSVEQARSGIFVVQGETPADFNGDTDKFGSEVVTLENRFAPIDRRETHIVFPLNEEGKSFYTQRAVDSTNRQIAIDRLGI